jgi:hypothetical protein
MIRLIKKHETRISFHLYERTDVFNSSSMTAFVFNSTDRHDMYISDFPGEENDIATCNIGDKRLRQCAIVFHEKIEDVMAAIDEVVEMTHLLNL